MRRIEGRAPRKCPLCPQEQTFSEARSMSAKCQKQTSKAWQEIAPDYLETGMASDAGHSIKLDPFRGADHRTGSQEASLSGPRTCAPWFAISGARRTGTCRNARPGAQRTTATSKDVTQAQRTLPQYALSLGLKSRRELGADLIGLLCPYANQCRDRSAPRLRSGRDRQADRPAIRSENPEKRDLSPGGRANSVSAQETRTRRRSERIARCLSAHRDPSYSADAV